MTSPPTSPAPGPPAPRGPAWRFWALLLAGLVVLGVAGFAVMRPGAENLSYVTTKLETGAVTKQVDATGTVVARGSVQVGSEISGRVARIAVDFNAEVKEGQLLAELASENYRTRVTEAEADVELVRALLAVAHSKAEQMKAEAASARARILGADAERAVADAALTFARVEFQRRTGPGLGLAATDRDRARADLDRAVAQRQVAEAQASAMREVAAASSAAVRTAEAEVGVAEATVRQRQAVLARARFDFERTEVRAPISGVIIERNIEVGQTVVASLQSPVLFTIARDLSEMQVELFVDEADIGSLREGQAVEFRVAAHPSRFFVGEIAQLRLAPLLIQNVVTYVAILAVSNSERLLRPGLTAMVRVKIEEREGVPRLPNAALRFRPQRGETVTKFGGGRSALRNSALVHVQMRSGLREVMVETGLVDERFTEIRAGLAAEDVVVAGYR